MSNYIAIIRIMQQRGEFTTACEKLLAKMVLSLENDIHRMQHPEEYKEDKEDVQKAEITERPQ